MAREAAKHPAPLREALPEAPSRPDTKGGVAAAASLRRSRSPESPRLRRRLRLLLRQFKRSRKYLKIKHLVLKREKVDPSKLL